MKFINKLLLLSMLNVVVHARSLPVESSLINGTLDNGFKYTLKKNPKPVAKAEMRLFIGVGSLEEGDDQKGVAHMVEHMAFNGSKHFPKNSLIQYLESIGVAFGSHLNASTGTTRTLYKLSVPLKDNNLEKSFLIFEDWASGLSFDSNELEKERGVILEEARSRDNLGFRLYQKSKNTLYADSKYKDRTPIGDLDIVKNVKLSRVKAFYDEWYRPEFMHLVLVGDFDVSKIEKLINKHFAHLKNSSQRERASRSIPKIDKKRVLFVGDKELTSNSVSLYYFHNTSKITTVAQYREKILKSVALKVFNLQNSEQLSKKNPLVNSIKMRSSKLGDSLKATSFSASYDGDDNNASLKELSNAIYTSDKFGFTKESLNAVVGSMNKANEIAFKNIGTSDSSTYANRIISHISKESIFIDEKFNYSLLKKVLSSLSLADVNRAFSSLITEESMLFLFSLQNETKLSKEQILSSIKEVKKALKKPLKARELPSTAMSTTLIPQKLVSQKYHKESDFWELTLNNGVKVIFKFNDYKKNRVNLYAYSKGGYSLVDDKLLTNAKFASALVTQSGTSKYSSKELRKIYSSKKASLMPFISRYKEGFKGGSLNKDFETLLELVYLAHTDYIVDENILKNFKKSLAVNIERQLKNPKTKFSKEFSNFYRKNHLRFLQNRAKDIQTITKADVLNTYENRFKDANNFVYIITGDIEYEKVKSLANKYLANLPTQARQESYRDRKIRPLKGKHDFIRFYDNSNISTLSLNFITQAPYSLEESIRLKVLKDLLSVKLRELIREEKSGVYGVQVKASISRVPYEKVAISIRFTCNPKRREELLSYVKLTINELKEKPVRKKYLNAIVKKQLLDFNQNIKKATFWQKKLKDYSFYGDNINNIKEYREIYNSISPRVIQAYIGKYLKDSKLIYSELNPIDDNDNHI